MIISADSFSYAAVAVTIIISHSAETDDAFRCQICEEEFTDFDPLFKHQIDLGKYEQSRVSGSRAVCLLH
jgi:hypothetical protein